jgi:hypothetical protein
VDGEDSFGEDFVSAADQALKKKLVGISPGTFADLDNEGGFGLQIASKQTDGLFQVVDIISTDGVFTVRSFKQFFSRDNHSISFNYLYKPI